MQVLTLLVIALQCLFNVSCFDFYGLGNGYRYLLYQISKLSVQADKAIVVSRWIDQPVDHFNKKDKRIWQMRYFERLDLWKANGPLYLFIGGEGEASPGFLKGGLTYELAKETNGALFMSEHRYYGKSMPLKNKGVKNLKYLSAKQALADIARLIRRLKLLPTFKNSKVVAIGGSYPGNLAAWFRLMYPDLVDAALSSSAPVVAKKNFYEYLETVSDDYEQYGTPGCWEYIQEQFEKYDHAFKTQEGIKNLTTEENICSDSDMNYPENQQLFVYHKASDYMLNAQYGNENKIKKHCNELMNNTRYKHESSDLDKYIHDIKMNYFDREKKCIEINFDEIIDEIKNGGSWLTSWVYQMCTEFSYAKSTSSENQPFGKNIPIETFYKICVLSFGDAFNEKSIEEKVKFTNDLYGGLKPNVTKVVFVNGELDPWHRLGILEDVSYEAPAKFIPRASHCMDLLSDRKGDPEELLETRKYVKHLIKSWIGIETCDKKRIKSIV